jgi:SAM-dependent methyltransferase
LICPICQSAAIIPALCPVVLNGTAPIYDLVECSKCGTRFLKPLPQTDDLNRFYAPHYYGSDWYKQEGMGRMFGRVFLPQRPTGKFLDVGCSLGFFLDGIRRTSDWQVYGVEISPEAVAFAREKLNLDVRCGELDTVRYPDHFFDCIRINNVLEHVRNPSGFLKECRRILRTGGRAHLYVPNGPVDSASLIRYYKSEKQPARSKDGHLFFFSQDSLRHMLQDADFEALSSHTCGIRRGLRALGYWPQKAGWKRHYRANQATPAKPGIQLSNEKKRPPGYYAYRFWQARLKMLPGQWKVGLDFEIVLRAN